MSEPILKMPLSDACSICGCKIVVCEGTEVAHHLQGGIREHCNGQRWDYRKFLCGQTVRWIPNYGKEKIDGSCTKEPAYIAREKAIEKIRNEIKKLEKDLSAYV